MVRAPHAPDQQVDVEHTGLGLAVTLGRDALKAGVHRDASLVFEAALGTPASCGNDCVQYPSSDHPVADVAHVAIDFMRYDESRAFLDGLAKLVRERPEVAEKLLVAAGKLVSRARAADVDLEPAQVVRLARDLLPLLERIFSAGGQTPRLLLQAVHDLGTTSRVFPTRLGWTIDYAQLTKSPTCSDNAPDLSRSRAVDYKSPGGGSNRSSLEQVIELLASVDCGTVPFTGKTVGVFVLDTVAGMKPSTVCGVTDTLLGALHITGVVGDFFTKLTLRGIGCSDADRVVSNLDALEDLAASGALDFLIPLDKVFADQGQLRTLIEIFKVVADDLALDEDASVSTHSVFRQIEPVISDLIAEGAADALFDLTDVLVTVQSTDAHGQQTTLGNVLVDAVAFGIGTRDVPTRAGVVHSSHAAELLDPGERVFERLSSEERKAALGRVVDHITGYLRARPDGLLADRAILPFLRILLDGASDVWALPQATRDCYVDGLGSDAERLLLSPELARLMRATAVLRDAPERPLLEEVAIDFLSALPAPATNVRSPLLQVSAELLESTAPKGAFSALVPYLSKVIDPDVTHGPAALNTLDALVQHDPDQVFLNILRKSVHAEGTNEAPAARLLHAYTPALAVTGPTCSPEYEPWTSGGLDSAVHSLLDLLRDPQHGMPALFDALEQMAFP
jgi:hypothetical protein